MNMKYLVLNPCQCGKKAPSKLERSYREHWKVRCTQCPTFTWGDTPDEAIDKWNTDWESTHYANAMIMLTGLGPGEHVANLNKVIDCCRRLAQTQQNMPVPMTAEERLLLREAAKQLDRLQYLDSPSDYGFHGSTPISAPVFFLLKVKADLETPRNKRSWLITEQWLGQLRLWLSKDDRNVQEVNNLLKHT